MKSTIEVNRSNPMGYGQSGVGYVVIPDNNNRQQYIDDCFRTRTITICGGYGYGFTACVPILLEVLSQIDFPLTAAERGSEVLWIRENFSNRPFVIGKKDTDGEANLLTEKQKRIFEQYNDDVVEVFLDGKNNQLNINVIGQTNNPSTINIKCSSQSEESTIKLETNGIVNVEANEIDATVRKAISVSLKSMTDEDLVDVSVDENSFSITDHFDNKIEGNKDNVQIVCKKLNVCSGAQPMVLGNTLVEILSEMIDAIDSLTVPTPHGVSGTPINSYEFTTIKSKLQEILSGISNTD